MIATNSIELKSGFDLFLDKVENENETLFIESEKGKGVVMISK
jgi:PHD/YefM family antitoxin component YafN of YafNO toxin-antitoxin module